MDDSSALHQTVTDFLRYFNLYNFILHFAISQALSIHDRAGITESLREIQRAHSHVENQMENLMN